MMRNALLGKPGRDQDIENVCRTIRAVGEAGVPQMRWNCGPDYLFTAQTGYTTITGRGGAGYQDQDFSRVENMPPFPEFGTATQDEMWKNAVYLSKPVMEAAEKANVKMALHPNDPPKPLMRGLARVFHHPDILRRYHQEVPSPANGLCFCQGTIAEMGVNVLDEIRYFGSRKRIFHVHFRSVRGTIPHYTEVFIDEGDLDMLQAMKAYKEVGFTGLLVSDHTPRVEGDTSWGHIGRAFSMGYIRALVKAVNAT
jgi:mannonate dehydratase